LEANPKCRIGKSMIEDAEVKGAIIPGKVMASFV
jgi:cysteine synthase